MAWKTLGVKARSRLVSWYVLAGGLVSSLILYLVVPPIEEDRLKDLVESRGYTHALQAWGGKANVLQDEFGRWFVSLWHGKQLAATVAWFSVLVFLAIHLILAQNRYEGHANANSSLRKEHDEPSGGSQSASGESHEGGA